MKVKKCLLTLAVVLPLAMGSICAAAHAHAYSHMGPYTIKAVPGTSHPYIEGTVTAPDGKVTYIYGTCDTVRYTYREYDQCACGATINMHDYGVEWHSACGQ